MALAVDSERTVKMTALGTVLVGYAAIALEDLAQLEEAIERNDLHGLSLVLKQISEHADAERARRAVDELNRLVAQSDEQEDEPRWPVDQAARDAVQRANGRIVGRCR